MTDEKKSADLEAAELRKAEADAVKAEIEAEKLYHELREQKRLAKRKKQDDKFEDANEHTYNGGTYRFVQPVSSSSVFACIDWVKTMRRYKPGADLTVEFNSPGGLVFEGLQLFDQLREASNDGHKVITYVGGLAASMAAVLSQAGDERLIGRNAWLMIHAPATGVMGNAFDIADEAALIQRMTDKTAEVFANRSTNPKMTQAKVAKLFDRRDCWLDAGEALEYGFIDRVVG